jgi:hypothetical protein
MLPPYSPILMFWKWLSYCGILYLLKACSVIFHSKTGCVPHESWYASFLFNRALSFLNVLCLSKFAHTYLEKSNGEKPRHLTYFLCDILVRSLFWSAYWIPDWFYMSIYGLFGFSATTAS